MSETLQQPSTHGSVDQAMKNLNAVLKMTTTGGMRVVDEGTCFVFKGNEKFLFQDVVGCFAIVCWNEETGEGVVIRAEDTIHAAQAKPKDSLRWKYECDRNGGTIYLAGTNVDDTAMEYFGVSKENALRLKVRDKNHGGTMVTFDTLTCKWEQLGLKSDPNGCVCF